MGENLKLDIDRTIGIVVDANIINIVINLKDNHHPVYRDTSLDPDFFNARERYRVSKPMNLMNFFLNLLKEGDIMKTDANYLKFFRNIVVHKKHGVSSNQDLMFKLLEANPKFAKTALISFIEYSCFLNLTFLAMIKIFCSNSHLDGLRTNQMMTKFLRFLLFTKMAADIKFQRARPISWRNN